jgi:hypothetical protein
MIEHGLVGNPLQVGNARNLCKCGRKFADERGLDIHVGKMGKLSALVSERSLELREKGESQ